MIFVFPVPFDFMEAVVDVAPDEEFGRAHALSRWFSFAGNSDRWLA